MKNSNRSVQFYFYISIIASIFVILLKATAWYITNSVGLLADAMESVINLVTALFGLWMFNYSQTPPDKEHQFGHTKAEYFGGIFEGCCIFFAAISISVVALYNMTTNAVLPTDKTGLIISFVATVINFSVGYLLIQAGRQLNSVSLSADGKHLMSDVWTSLGVVVGVAIAVVLNIPILDSLIALLVSLYIGYEGFKVINTSVHGLLDCSLSIQEISAIKELIEKNTPQEVVVHKLVSRVSGKIKFVHFKLLVKPNWTVQRAHDLCDFIEIQILEVYPECIIEIHVEPDRRGSCREEYHD